MKAFYTTLLRSGDLNSALNEARKCEPTFRDLLAEAIFMKGWRKASEQYPTTAKAIQEKTEQMITVMKNAGLPLPPRAHARMKAAIREIDMNNPFQAFRRKFFMLDLFPEVEDEIAGISLEDVSASIP